MIHAYEIYDKAYKALVANVKEMIANGWNGEFNDFKTTTYDSVTGNIYLLDIKKIYLNDNEYLKLVVDYYDTKGKFILHTEDRGFLYDNITLSVVEAVDRIYNSDFQI